MKLLANTQRMLGRAKSKASLYEIAADSDGRVNYEWLKKFAAGKIKNPGVNTIEDLRAVLKARA